MLTEISSFDFLPSDQILNEWIFNFSDDKSYDTNFELMGYERLNMLSNLGSLVIYLLGYFILCAVTLVLKIFESKSEM